MLPINALYCGAWCGHSNKQGKVTHGKLHDDAEPTILGDANITDVHRSTCMWAASEKETCHSGIMADLPDYFELS